MVETLKERLQRELHERVWTESFDPATDKTPLPEKPHHSGEDKERLRELAKKTLVVGALDKDRREAALDYFVKTHYKAGDIIYNAGDQGNTFYLIDSGKFVSYDENGERLKVLQKSFGDLALLYRETRAYTVKCDQDGYLWQIDRPLYNKIVVTLAYNIRQRQLQLLRGLDMLALLEPYECVRLCGAVEYKPSCMYNDLFYSEGHEIYAQTDPALGVYFVDEGEVELRKDGEVTETIREGGHFGQLALLYKHRRDHQAVAVKRTRCWYLSADYYETVMSSLYRLLKKRKPEDWKKIARKYFGSEEPQNIEFRLAKPPNYWSSIGL